MSTDPLQQTWNRGVLREFSPLHSWKLFFAYPIQKGVNEGSQRGGAAAANETAGCSGLSCVDFAGVSHFSEPNSTARYTNVGRKRARGRGRERERERKQRFKSVRRDSPTAFASTLERHRRELCVISTADNKEKEEITHGALSPQRRDQSPPPRHSLNNAARQRKRVQAERGKK